MGSAGRTATCSLRPLASAPFIGRWKPLDGGDLGHARHADLIALFADAGLLVGNGGHGGPPRPCSAWTGIRRRCNALAIWRGGTTYRPVIEMVSSLAEQPRTTTYRPQSWAKLGRLIEPDAQPTTGTRWSRSATRVVNLLAPTRRPGAVRLLAARGPAPSCTSAFAGFVELPPRAAAGAGSQDLHRPTTLPGDDRLSRAGVGSLPHGRVQPGPRAWKGHQHRRRPASSCYVCLPDQRRPPWSCSGLVDEVYAARLVRRCAPPRAALLEVLPCWPSSGCAATATVPVRPRGRCSSTSIRQGPDRHPASTCCRPTRSGPAQHAGDGQTFWSGAVAYIGGWPDEINERLEDLQNREVVQSHQHSEVLGSIEYSFRHILIRDVAYGRLPKRERAACTPHAPPGWISTYPSVTRWWRSSPTTGSRPASSRPRWGRRRRNARSRRRSRR